MTLNQRELAALLQITPQQVQNLVTRGMPIDRTGRTPRYDAGACLVWYVKQKQDEAVRRYAPTDADGARARKLAAEARLAELEVAKTEGLLLAIADVERQWQQATAVLAAKCRAAPGRWAPQAVGLRTVAEAQERLRGLFAELLLALSETGDDLDADPDPPREQSRRGRRVAPTKKRAAARRVRAASAPHH